MKGPRGPRLGPEERPKSSAEGRREDCWEDSRSSYGGEEGCNRAGGEQTVQIISFLWDGRRGAGRLRGRRD